MRQESTQEEAHRVLSALERLALVLLQQDTADLEEALRAEQKKEASTVGPVSVVSMRCLDTVELWRKAHDARLQVEDEEAVQDTIRTGKFLEDTAERRRSHED